MQRSILASALLGFSLAGALAIAQQKLEVEVESPREVEVRSEEAPATVITPGPLDRLQKSPRHHEFVDIDAPGGRKVKTWVVFPEVDHPATVVIVIHENRGLTDWVRAVADQLAEAGFVAVAPDLLSGTAPGGGNTTEYENEDAARTGIGKLPAEQVMSDLDAVYKYAKEMPAGNGVVAVGGFCWGGGKTFAYAAHNPKIAAAFVFYGSEPQNEADYKKINAPVFGFYGGNDFRITGAVPNVEKKMKAAGKLYEAVVYKGAGHGFMRQGEVEGASEADRKARDEAWEQWKQLLSEKKTSRVRPGPSAEVVRARVVPFSREGSLGTQMVLVDWRNIGTTTIRAVDADIIPFDSRGRNLESGAEKKADICRFRLVAGNRPRRYIRRTGRARIHIGTRVSEGITRPSQDC